MTDTDPPPTANGTNANGDDGNNTPTAATGNNDTTQTPTADASTDNNPGTSEADDKAAVPEQPPAKKPRLFGSFDSECKRILKPGHEFFNLNPYDVLQLPLEFAVTELKRRYRMLSMVVHPDKNPDNPDAQKAFDYVSEANKTLKDPDKFHKCQEIVREAKRRVTEQLQKGHYLSQENGKKLVDNELAAVLGAGKGDAIRTEAEKLMVTKIFIEHKSRQDEVVQLANANKRREEEQRLARERERKLKKVEAAQWENKREDRVSDWRSWQTDGQKKQRTQADMQPKLKKETLTGKEAA